MSGLGIELIHYLSHRFILSVRVAFWRSILKPKRISNMKVNSFPSGRNQFEIMQTKNRGSTSLIIGIDRVNRSILYLTLFHDEKHLILRIST